MQLRLTAAVPRVFFLVALAGCASAAAPRRGWRAPITPVELEAAPAATVLQAVQRLRPQWTARLVGAFLDTEPISPGALTQEPVRGVAEIRLLTAEEATARFGTRALSGTYLHVIRRR